MTFARLCCILWLKVRAYLYTYPLIGIQKKRGLSSIDSRNMSRLEIKIPTEAQVSPLQGFVSLPSPIPKSIKNVIFQAKCEIVSFRWTGDYTRMVLNELSSRD